jgi:predicted nuclease of predicted toxin-antitoxin system
MEVGLDRSLDKEVWNYARQHEYLILTKDVDISELSLIMGFPPKVIWLRRGNCSTHDIENILRENFNSINAMNEDEGIGITELF